MLLKNSTGLYKQTKQIELSKVMFCLIIMMMIESVLHTHTHLQSLTTKCYFKLTEGIVSYSSVRTWTTITPPRPSEISEKNENT